MYIFQCINKKKIAYILPRYDGKLKRCKIIIPSGSIGTRDSVIAAPRALISAVVGKQEVNRLRKMLISNFWPTLPGKATTAGHCHNKQKSILAAIINFNNLSNCSIMEGRLFRFLISRSHTFRIPICSLGQFTFQQLESDACCLLPLHLIRFRDLAVVPCFYSTLDSPQGGAKWRFVMTSAQQGFQTQHRQMCPPVTDLQPKPDLRRISCAHERTRPSSLL